MLHGKVLTIHFVSSTDHICRLRASTPATSTLRITYFVKSKCERREHKAHKKHVVLSFSSKVMRMHTKLNI